ncbi:hypothetical protein diail_10362 [Diaporthe ilicicola]|nr:hypothetical protein diail_10362 [Diaporthe ilicicola]
MTDLHDVVEVVDVYYRAQCGSMLDGNDRDTPVTATAPDPHNTVKRRRGRTSKPRVKTGCNNCKQRRIKCDETRPACTQCIRSKKDCSGYPPPPRGARRSEEGRMAPRARNTGHGDLSESASSIPQVQKTTQRPSPLNSDAAMSPRSLTGKEPPTLRPRQGRPLSGQINMAESRQPLKYDIWRKSSKPVDIPGRPSPHAPGKLRVCTSLVESPDVLLSRSLLEQCRLDESPGNISPNSTEASWKSRWWSDAANSNKTSLSTCRTRGSSTDRAPIMEEDKCQDHDGPGQEEPPGFPKQQTAAQRCWSHVSALSTMLGKVQCPQPICPQKHDIWALMATARKFQPCLGKLARCYGQDSRKAQSCPNPRTQGIIDEEEAMSPSSASKPVAIPTSKSPLSRPARGDESTDTSYTNSDQTTAMKTSCSSGSSPGLLSREEQKRLLLDRLMDYFFAVLTRGQTHAGGGSGCSARPGSKPKDGGSGYKAIGAQNGPSRKGKQPASTDEHKGSDNEEDEAPRPKKAKSEEAEVRRLACPFFKRNPHRYKDQGKCVGPGWMTVHRLKEHLYRRHMLPIHCYRCHEVFPSDRLLQLHMRAESQCALRDEGPRGQLEGIDASQERLLRSRKRTDRTEGDKWRDVFRICFPADMPDCMPSPWFELPVWGEGASSVAAAAAAGPASDIAQYEDFLRRELPRRVRGELEVRIEQELSPVEESLKRQLVDIVRDMQQRLFADFRRLQGEGAPRRDEVGGDEEELRCVELVDGADVKDKGKPAASQSPEQLTTIETSGASLLDDLIEGTPPITAGWAASTSQPIDMYRQPQPFFDSSARFDGVVFDLGQGCGDWSWADSGYMSAAMSAASSKVIADDDGVLCDVGTMGGHLAHAGMYGEYRDGWS